MLLKFETDLKLYYAHQIERNLQINYAKELVEVKRSIY